MWTRGLRTRSSLSWMVALAAICKYLPSMRTEESIAPLRLKPGRATQSARRSDNKVFSRLEERMSPDFRELGRKAGDFRYHNRQSALGVTPGRLRAADAHLFEEDVARRFVRDQL